MKILIKNFWNFKIAVLIDEDNNIEDIIIDEIDKPKAKEIYLAKIKRKLESMQCYFIDIGHEKNAFMKFKDKEDDKNNEFLVQILKEGKNNKGPRVTQRLSLSGRFIVLLTDSNSIKISNKIQDEEERKRLRKIATQIIKDNEYGILIRTNGEKRSKEEFQKDFNYLKSIMNDLIKKSKNNIAPKLLFNKNEKIISFIKDNKANIKEIILDDEEIYDEIMELNKFYKDIDAKAIRLEEKENYFENYDVYKNINKLLSNEVSLNDEGSLVIDELEALNIIDINTGKKTQGGNLKKIVHDINIMAAKEIVKQIKLRNLSGIILIDFIDTKDKNEKKQIKDILQEGLKNQNANAYGFTKLNLFEISRQREKKSLKEYFTQNKKENININGNYLEFRIKREIELIKKNNISEIIFYLEDRLMPLINDIMIKELEFKYNIKIKFEHDKDKNLLEIKKLK
ncbi:MAG: ribonuclease E/G [Peptostreptococcaceae bacterium]|jgi:ribonuclease G|nr:ribonuclease E/G [Peptostreptococcaceae bacterium]